MTWKPDVCLYHFPCDDGFAAAYVTQLRWPDVEMAPTNYGLPLPDVEIDGKHILIADFSYKPDVLADLASRAASIVILDHHKTAEEDLANVNRIVRGDCESVERCFARVSGPGMNVIAEFDMERSGSGITWDFCFPGKPRPALLRHIEDRDLWRMAFTETRAVSLYLRSFPYEFDAWAEIFARFEDDAGRESILREAEAVERFYDRKIDEMLPTATLKKIGKWDGVPVAHAPYAFASDLAHAMLQAHPEAPFAAVAVDAYGGRTYSLRSENEREDVSAVARTFGGGGHRNAAGFRVPA